jgi:hypothetical protein
MIYTQLHLALFFIIPFNVETALYESSKGGNMGLNGIFIEIYYKRNLVYLTVPLLIFSYFFKYFIFGLTLSAFSLLFYLQSCNKWYKYLCRP